MQNRETRTMKFEGLDDWGVPVYRSLETGILYKDLTPKHGELHDLHSCSNDFDGDPDYPLSENIEVVFKDKYNPSSYERVYQMLSRLQSDCNYYLGYGNRYAGHLWAKDEQVQIDEMKRLYNLLPAGEKPEWLTWEDILNYEALMLGE